MADLEKGLRPCPFCGTKENGDGKLRMHIAESSEGYFTVVCWCGGSGPIMESKRTAVEAWNARGPDDRQQVQYPFYSSMCTNPVGFRGNLKSVALSTILQILSTDNRTGVLHFEQGQAMRAICLKDGKIVAASGREGQRLGQMLYDRGMISQKQLEEALEKTKEEKKRLGEVLLDLGYINEDSLKELIRYQIQEAVLDISLWAEGDFEYRDCQMEFDERGIEDISTMRLVLEAAAKKDEWVAA
jgi:Lar family restriction alleviation protein